MIQFWLASASVGFELLDCHNLWLSNVNSHENMTLNFFPVTLHEHTWKGKCEKDVYYIIIDKHAKFVMKHTIAS